MNEIMIKSQVDLLSIYANNPVFFPRLTFTFSRRARRGGAMTAGVGDVSVLSTSSPMSPACVLWGHDSSVKEGRGLGRLPAEHRTAMHLNARGLRAMVSLDFSQAWSLQGVGSVQIASQATFHPYQSPVRPTKKSICYGHPVSLCLYAGMSLLRQSGTPGWETPWSWHCLRPPGTGISRGKVAHSSLTHLTQGPGCRQTPRPRYAPSRAGKVTSLTPA